MTPPGEHNEHDEHDDTTTPPGERLVRTGCRACGKPIDYAGTGRPPRYCSRSCRNRGWALRQAAAELDRGDTGPEVVREVVATDTVPIAGKPPDDLPGWTRQLETLTRQLNSNKAPAGNDEQHHRLAWLLARALLELDRRTPAGLDWTRLPTLPGSTAATDAQADPPSPSQDGESPSGPLPATTRQWTRHLRLLQQHLHDQHTSSRAETGIDDALTEIAALAHRIASQALHLHTAPGAGPSRNSPKKKQRNRKRKR